jgi:Zn-dependent protease with chaperone function
VIATVALSGYAILLGVVGPRWWRRQGWAVGSPRTALTVLLTGQASAGMALILGGLCLVVPASTVSRGVSFALSACVIRLREVYAVPGGSLTEAAGAGLAAAALGHLMYSSVVVAFQDALTRRRHREKVLVLGRRDPRGMFVLVDDRPAIYCVPGGRRACIVATTAALDSLNAEELQAALAHERAHLHGRHHLLVAIARVMDRLLAPLGFTKSEPQVRQLTEMLADDVAGTRHDGRVVAEALVALAQEPTPAVGFGMAGGAERVARLVAPSAPLSRWRAVSIAASAVALVLLPVALAVTPAMAVRVVGPVHTATADVSVGQPGS